MLNLFNTCITKSLLSNSIVDEHVTVITHPTISLVKYFGLRSQTLRLPSRSSFALSLAQLTTTTHVTFNNEQNEDTIVIEDYSDKHGVEMVRSFVDKFRDLTGVKRYFKISSKNNFPTASGLASSGSGFAALSIALSELCTLNFTKEDISKIARYGSGSAVRSIYGGMIFWHRGQDYLGDDCFAETLFPSYYWPELRMIVVAITNQPKELSTRDAGKLIIKSPSYQKWVNAAEERIALIINGLQNKDLDAIGKIMEQDCIEMHHCLKEMGIVYHTKETGDVIKTIRRLRDEGISCYWTSDAGPQIKVLCFEKEVELITDRIKESTPEVECIISEIGDEPLINKELSKRYSARL